MSRIKELTIKRITFDEIVDFWKETGHFNDPNKKYVRTVGYLGHFERAVKDPHFSCYGLFYNKKMIGVTQISAWSKDWVRYRTIHILNEYRGQNHGWQFLCSCIAKDWKNYLRVFGWIKKSHIDWSLKNNFTFIDNKWSDHHTGMIADVNYLCANSNLISFSE